MLLNKCDFNTSSTYTQPLAHLAHNNLQHTKPLIIWWAVQNAQNLLAC